jgi:hypothetical protein
MTGLGEHPPAVRSAKEMKRPPVGPARDRLIRIPRNHRLPGLLSKVSIIGREESCYCVNSFV